MKYEQALEVLSDVPHISPERGKELYDFVLREECSNILELGFAHGTSTCYMAAALDELGVGKITTIDQESAKRRDPGIHALLKKLSLQRFVDPLFSPTSYIWELKKIIERQSTDNACVPLYDFVFLDGAHTWEVDGLAFFLTEKLLKPGGWMLFDDLNWTLASSPSMSALDSVKKMPKDMKTKPHVSMIYTLLACQHEHIGHVERDNGWGWIRKRSQSDLQTNGKALSLIAYQDDIDFRAGFYPPESTHVWLQKTARLEVRRPLKEFEFALVPPADAIRINGNIHVAIHDSVTDETIRHTFEDAGPYTFSAASLVQAQVITITTSADYCPADHGSKDSRHLALNLFDIRLSRA